MRTLNIIKDERILNLASEFESDNIWPLFGEEKTVKIRIFENIPILTFLGQKGVSNGIRFES